MSRPIEDVPRIEADRPFRARWLIRFADNGEATTADYVCEGWAVTPAASPFLFTLNDEDDDPNPKWMGWPIQNVVWLELVSQ